MNQQTLASETDQGSVFSDLASADSKVLQVTFGGIRGGLAIAPFEFYKLTSSFATKKLFVRELNQTWSHGALPGIGAGVEALANYLGAFIEAQNVERVVFVGNSMGGYAAILLGTLLNVDQILAFAPQTFISRWLRLQYLDRRWQAQISNIYRLASAQPMYFDLARVLKRGGRTGRIDIYLDSSSRLDKVHGNRLARLPRVTIHKFRTGGHELVKQLRDQGLLREILLGALAAPAQD